MVNDAIDSPTEFTVQVCAGDGRLISEYSLTWEEHQVRTLAAAERCALTELSNYRGEPVVVVVSEQTLTKLRQVHVNLVPNEPCE